MQQTRGTLPARLVCMGERVGGYIQGGRGNPSPVLLHVPADCSSISCINGCVSPAFCSSAKSLSDHHLPGICRPALSADLGI